MAKRRKSYRSSKCPDPINGMLDLAAALTLGLYTKHKIKKDFEKGEGEESAKAAGMVFGLGAMRGGSRGIMNLGGLIGLNSALKDIDRKQQSKYIPSEPPYVDKVLDAPKTVKPHINKHLWRRHCEDGSAYGIDPQNYDTADAYYDALNEAKQGSAQKEGVRQVSHLSNSDDSQVERKYIWRKYCEDGSEYGIDPVNYETADDYEDALIEAKEKGNIQDR